MSGIVGHGAGEPTIKSLHGGDAKNKPAKSLSTKRKHGGDDGGRKKCPRRGSETSAQESEGPVDVKKEDDKALICIDFPANTHAAGTINHQMHENVRKDFYQQPVAIRRQILSALTRAPAAKKSGDHAVRTKDAADARDRLSDESSSSPSMRSPVTFDSGSEFESTTPPVEARKIIVIKRKTRVEKPQEPALAVEPATLDECLERVIREKVSHVLATKLRAIIERATQEAVKATLASMHSKIAELEAISLAVGKGIAQAMHPKTQDA